ncbi:rhomboid-related [Anaeramoeba flamelloides]|uniref:rhomboid protease n=1 Tax=Anaeramoeba flamelloides TaxID=1746091 RepID=A0ABQ8XNZ6_9EUKA|nr:rhomboid-related [Anaeramoeba flamelloides]
MILTKQKYKKTKTTDRSTTSVDSDFEVALTSSEIEKGNSSSIELEEQFAKARLPDLQKESQDKNNNVVLLDYSSSYDSDQLDNTPNIAIIQKNNDANKQTVNNSQDKLLNQTGFVSVLSDTSNNNNENKDKLKNQKLEEKFILNLDSSSTSSDSDDEYEIDNLEIKIDPSNGAIPSNVLPVPIGMRGLREVILQMYEEDLNPKKYPIVIWLFSFIQVVLFVVSIIINGGVEKVKYNPLLGASEDTLITMGAKDTSLIIKGGVWRLIVSVTEIEKMIGHYRILMIYLVSVIGGNLTSAVFLPNIVSCGSSSALYGFVGIQFCDLFQNWKLIKNPKITLIKLFLVVIISLSFGLMPSIDNFAHIGGLVYGILMGIIILPYLNFGKTRKIFVKIAVPTLIGVFILEIFLLFFLPDINNICENCKYLNCLPINNWCDQL